MVNNNNNNNIAIAQKQNSVFYASLSANTSRATNIPSSKNANYTGNISPIPASISLPLSRGYVNGKLAYFIATDASDNSTALEISRNLRFKVNFSPSLALIPESSRQQGYEFLNGVKGQGAFGFQLPVASKLPVDKGYTPIVQLNFVKWNYNNNATKNHIPNTVRELKSVSEILAAERNHELSITPTNILINSPAVSVIP
ncbi:MAG TPA: hypothetical protein VJ729_18340 [Nitrososphaeraceae archaeon]|nr:hypothetical protein [Nitrososphaeraceae archaeon]